MSKKDERIFWNALGAIVALVLIIWFLSKVIDILTRNPEPLRFVLGIMATIVVEGLIYFGVVIFRPIRGY
jgi:F0F1-type ATP synthase membrane subunit c/vacuolar-type H+-ATPase subunit K